GRLNIMYKNKNLKFSIKTPLFTSQCNTVIHDIVTHTLQETCIPVGTY
ncbi:unnamed protein product, partial [marine sediment metagenome]